MSGLKSGAIVLLVAVPFGLYVAWQVQKVTTGDLLVAEAPSDKGLPNREHFLEARGKAEKWSADVRKASAVVYQYRAPAADDLGSDPECAALVRSTGTRAADLADLEKFLARVANPVFAGKLKDRYRAWYEETESLRLAAAAVEQWFEDRGPMIEGPDDVAEVTKQFTKIVDPYTKNNSIFMDRGLVAGWRVRVIARVIEGLADAARAPYKRVLDLPLPLPAEDKNADVRTAVGALREMKVHVERLDKAVAQARADGLTLPEKAQAARSRAVDTAKEWSAGDELLTLFADPQLITDPNKAATWLPRVQEQLAVTQSPAGREMIRKKVQQFCDAYIPKQARLDTEVLYRGARKPRATVSIEYTADKELGLTDRPDELNEFNFRKQFRNDSRIICGGMFTGMPDSLKPTPKSLAAWDFSQARAEVMAWTPVAVNRLKMKCEGDGGAVKQEERRTLLDELVGFSPDARDADRAWTKENTKISTRLSALSAAMAKHPTLFETDPKTPRPAVP